MAISRRNKIILIAAVCAAAVAIIATVVLIQVRPVQRYVSAQLRQTLGQYGIAFGDAGLGFSAANLSIVLENVVVRSPDAPDLPPMAVIPEVRLNLDLPALIRNREYVIDSAVLVRPAVEIVVTETGNNMIPVSAGTTTTATLRRLTARDGSLVFEDRSARVSATVPQWDVEIRSHAGGTIAVQFRQKREGALTLPSAALPVSGLAIDADTAGGVAVIHRLDVRVAGSDLLAKGTVGFEEPRPLDLSFTGTVRPGGLLAQLGRGREIEGPLQAHGTISGTLSDPKIDAELQGKGLRADNLKDIGLAARADYDARSGRVRIPSFRLDTPAGAATGEAVLALSPKAGRSTLDARLNKVDLRAIGALAGIGFTLASYATGTVSASWPGLDYSAANLDSDLRLAAIGVAPREDALPITADLAARLRNRDLTLNFRSFETLGASGSGLITLGGLTNLGGTINASTPNAGQTLGQFERLLGRNIGVEGVTGAARVTLRLAGTLKQPTIDFEVAMPGISAGTGNPPAQRTALSTGEPSPSLPARPATRLPLPLIRSVDNVVVGAIAAAIQEQLQAERDAHFVRIIAAALRQDQQGETPQGQQQQDGVIIRGRIQLGRGAPRIQAEAEVREQPLEALLGLAGLSGVPVRGSFNATGSISGAGSRLRGDMRLAVPSFELYGQALGILTAHVELDGNEIRVPSFRIEHGPGFFGGWVIYNRATRAFRFEAAADQYPLEQLDIPGLVPVSGSVTLEAKGSGTPSNPSLTAEVHLSDLVAAGHDIGALVADVDIANQVATVKARSPVLHAVLDARVVMQQPFPAGFTLALDNTPLGAVPVALPGNLGGTVTATVTGSVPVAQWRQGKAVARVESLDAVYNAVPVSVAQAPLVVAYDNGVVTFEPSTILAGPTRIAISGSLPVEQPLGREELFVDLHADLRTLSALVPLQPGVAACGTLDVNTIIRGSVLAPAPVAIVNVENGCLELPGGIPPVTNATLTATLDNGVVRIDALTADWAGGRVQAVGAVPLGIVPVSLPIPIPTQTGPAELALDVTNLNVRNLPGVPPSISGVVSAHVEARAARPELDAVTATASFSELQLSFSGAPFKQTQPSILRLANGVMRVEQFRLAGPETTLEMSGTASATAPYPLDLRLTGNADAALIALATEAVRARGPINLNVAVTGTARAPNVTGTAQLSGVQMAIPTPGIQVDDLDALLRLAGQRIEIERLSALVNGGTVTADGGFAWAAGGLSNAAISIEAKDVYLNYPQGLNTVSDASLRLRTRQNDLLLAGKVTVLDGIYREQLTLDRLLSLSRGRSAEALEQPENPFLARLRMNVEVESESPVVVDNNLARIQALANLRVTNTLARPGLTGRIDIEEGGELYLAQRTYTVQRGIVQFTDERRIQPSFDVQATTESANFEITLALTGEAGRIEAQFTSQPPLSEPDIISLLLTGRTLQDIRGSEVRLAGAEALSYISGQLASTLGRQAEQAFGLTRVRIEPELIVADANPTARLTLGQQITHELNLVYSMDLTNSSDQIWIAEYVLGPRFLTRALKQQDNSFRFEFRRTVEFGSAQGRRPWFTPRPRMDIRHILFNGDLYFTERALRDELGLEPGGRYDFFKIHNRVDRLRQFYAKNGLLEARIRMRRVAVKENVYDLVFTINAGPVVQFAFEGWNPSGGLRNDVRQTWIQGVFDMQRVQEATANIQAALVGRGYVNADILPQIATPEPRLKRVAFVIDAGSRFAEREVAFEGDPGIGRDELMRFLKEQELLVRLYTDAPGSVEALTGFYRNNGFLDARVSLPNFLLDPERSYARVTIPVEAGPRYRLSRVVFRGNNAIPDSQLHDVIPAEYLGNYYRPDVREAIIDLLQEYYWQHGYTDVEVTYLLARYPEAGLADLVLNLNEGRQRVVSEINIAGTEVTSPSLVRGELKLEPGDPLNLEKLARSRANLYDTGAFWQVDIQHRPIGRAGARAPATDESGPLPVRLAVNVSEIQPFSLRYGGLYDTERGPGGIVDFANRNTLGAARVLGLRLQYDSQFRDARIYFAQPSTSGFFLKTAAAIYAQRQAVEPFITHRYGFTITEDARFSDHDILTFGYRIEQASSRYISPSPELPPPENMRVAPLSATFTRETRDSFINPTRGGFLSSSLEYASNILGSQERFLRYFGQYIRYVPLAAPTELPLTTTVWRSRWVYAGAVRLGLAGGQGGQELIATERFFAGGATSVRGYDQNSLGPTDALGNPVGGNAMFIVNNELRFPIYNVLGGAAFLDAGNVYATVSDFDPLRLRYGAGVGLRLSTPYILLRFDVGFKLFPKPGESRTKFYFSIGQAF